MAKQKKQKEITVDQLIRKFKKEAKAEGKKLSKSELNNMAIHYMNKPSEDQINEEMANQKIGQVSDKIKYVTEKFYIRETTRKLKMKDERSIEQKIFTDFDIEETSHVPEDCEKVLVHNTYHHNHKKKEEQISEEVV